MAPVSVAVSIVTPEHGAEILRHFEKGETPIGPIPPLTLWVILPCRMCKSCRLRRCPAIWDKQNATTARTKSDAPCGVGILAQSPPSPQSFGRELFPRAPQPRRFGRRKGGASSPSEPGHKRNQQTDLLTPNGVRETVSRVRGEQIRLSPSNPYGLLTFTRKKRLAELVCAQVPSVRLSLPSTV